MSVAKWMTSKVISIDQEDPVSLAFELLSTNTIRHLPVLFEGKIVGIITDRDLHDALVPADNTDAKGNIYHTIKNINAKKIMTPNPVTVLPHTPIERAAEILISRKIDCLPVKDKDARLVGIITSSDILKAFIKLVGFLGGSQRIDLVVQADEYQQIQQVLIDEGLPVLSVGITPHEDPEKTVLSFRLKNTDIRKVEKILKEKGYSVLGQD